MNQLSIASQRAIVKNEKTRRSPGVFRVIWEGWKSIAKRVGDFQARVLLFVFYFVFLMPFALAVRWWSDPLSIKPRSGRGWLRKPDHIGEELQRAQKQS